MENSAPLKGKTVIVTGAAGNLGEAVAGKFLQNGATVIGTVLHSEPDLNDNSTFRKVGVDLTNEAASWQFVETMVTKYGNLHAAILTVGGFAAGTIADTKTSDITKQYQLNFETAYNIARPVFLQMLKQNSGRIFLIGSKPGLDSRSGKGMIAYGLAKSLIFRLAELMNEEGKSHNVVTSVIVPGTIDTPQNRKAMPDANFDNWVKPEAIADVIYFYCSQQAGILREPLIKVYGNS
jgi:NAD(P)-dependent dehydrogenase (short-subunit alcohol dehydrogenase family)